MTQEQYDQYFTFTFVRNPWARVVSMYKYGGYYKTMDFKYFLMVEFRKKIWHEYYWFVGPQYEYIFNNGKLNVDFVGKFEDIQNDFEHVCRQLELPKIKVPHLNASLKYKVKDSWSNKEKRILRHEDFHDYYDNDSREVVADLYQGDIDLFGYKFE